MPLPNPAGTSYAPEGKVLDGGSGAEVAFPADQPCLLQARRWAPPPLPPCLRWRQQRRHACVPCKHQLAGGGLTRPRRRPLCLLARPRPQAAICCSLCNDSHLHYAADRGVYQRVGEATEVALRVLAEKVRGWRGEAGGRDGRCPTQPPAGEGAAAGGGATPCSHLVSPMLLRAAHLNPSLPPSPPAHQIGLPGYASMPSALAAMSRQERATYCNQHWGQEWRKVFTLEFSRCAWPLCGCGCLPGRSVSCGFRCWRGTA